MVKPTFGAPIFIGGCPRSGTTMLGAMLGAALGCVVTPESHFKHHLMRRCSAAPMTRTELLSFFHASNEMAFWGLSFQEHEFPEEINLANLAQVIDHVVLRYRESEEGSEATGCSALLRWVDHTPVNIERFSDLLELYPNARCVHIVRDPRGVAASVLPLAWGPNDAIRFAPWWQRHVAAGRALKELFAGRVAEVRYEDLVTNPEATLKQLCEFLELPFCPSLVHGQRFEPAEHSKRQHELVGQAPVQNRIEAWKNTLSARDAAYIEFACFAMMRELGYGPLKLKPATRMSGVSALGWYVKIGFNRLKGSIRRKLLRRSRARLAKKLRAAQI